MLEYGACGGIMGTLEQRKRIIRKEYKSLLIKIASYYGEDLTELDLQKIAYQLIEKWESMVKKIFADNNCEPIANKVITIKQIVRYIPNLPFEIFIK